MKNCQKGTKMRFPAVSGKEMGKASRWKDLGNTAVERGLCGEKLLEERER